jgi:hypothetical protein
MVFPGEKERASRIKKEVTGQLKQKCDTEKISKQSLAPTLAPRGERDQITTLQDRQTRWSALVATDWQF